MTALIPAHERQLDLIRQGSRMLAEAATIEAAKDIRDKAQAVEHYLRQRGGSEGAMLDAAELKLRAERRLGELLAETVNHNGSRGVGRTMRGTMPEGVTSQLSSRWQRAASIPADRFEQHVAESREAGELTTASVLRLAKELAQPGKQESPPIDNGCTVQDLQTLVAQGKRFGTVYADPPWSYSNQATRAATDNHYQTMSVDEIAALPVRELAAETCHLHLWTTNAFLFECPRILESWGFAYQGVFVWCKPQMGIGNCWRVSHEFLLLAIKGDPRKFRDGAHDLKSWASLDRDKHSSKPEQVRLMIEKASPGPYLELFGRKAVKPWWVWGNEVERDLFHQETGAL